MPKWAVGGGRHRYCGSGGGGQVFRLRVPRVAVRTELTWVHRFEVIFSFGTFSLFQFASFITVRLRNQRQYRYYVRSTSHSEKLWKITDNLRRGCSLKRQFTRDLGQISLRLGQQALRICIGSEDQAVLNCFFFYPLSTILKPPNSKQHITGANCLKGQCHEIFDHFLLKIFDLGPI